MSPKSKEKANPTVIVAVIGLAGTLITALLASPVLIALIEEEAPTATPPPAVTTEAPATEANLTEPVVPTDTPANPTQVLVFENTFNNETMDGFTVQSGEWHPGMDKNEPVLEGIGPADESQIAAVDFGAGDFSDGIIEFNMRFRTLGGFILSYRSSSDQVYSLYLDPLQREITIGYSSENNDWELEPFKGTCFRSHTFPLNTWYQVRLETVGDQVDLWINDEPFLSCSDSRLTTGGLSFMLQNGAYVLLDDVRVWELR